MIKLTVEGIIYEFDNGRLLLAEAREMKTYTGLTPPKWSAGLDDGDPDAVAALIYMAKKRAGETLRFSDLDSLDYADIQLEILDEDEDEQPDGEPQSGAGPTQTPAPSSSGVIPSDGTGATSPPSPTGSNTIPMTSAV